MGEFPKLMWLPDGREVTAHDEDEQVRLREDGARFSVDGRAEPVEVKTDPIWADVTSEKIDPFDGVEAIEDDESDKPKKKGKK